MSRFLFRGSLLVTAFLSPFLRADNPTTIPSPMVAWACSVPPGIELGAAQNPVNFTLHGSGLDPALNTIKIVPVSDQSRATDCKIFWTMGPDHRPTLNLASDLMRGSLSYPANRAARLECGDASSPGGLTELTACLKFRLTSLMAYSGSPSTEQDGKLITIGKTFTLGVFGSGQNGKQPRRLFVQVHPDGTVPVTFVGPAGPVIPLNHWTSVLVSWRPGSAGDVPQLLVDGVAVTLSPLSPASPAKVSLTGPIWLGGDDEGTMAPLEIEGFAVYDKVCSWNEAFAGLSRPAPVTTVAAEAQPQARIFTKLSLLGSPDAWTLTGSGATVSSPRDGVLAVNFGRGPAKTARLMLKGDGVSISGSDLLQYWFCLPVTSGNDIYHNVKAIFTDASGAEIKLDGGGGDTIHICPPNGRSAGLWETVTVPAPKPNRYIFRGFEIDKNAAPNGPANVLYLRDFGVDRTDYRKVALYYVIGGYRDNFAGVAFNGDGARALTDQSGDCSIPYLLLDNAIDQAKQGRPQSVNVKMECFDADNRLIWSGEENNIHDADALDALHKLPIPITAPGTYWIKSKSYDARNGEYSTTDWAQLCIIRGARTTLPVRGTMPVGLLHINPDKPFGRFDKGDPLRIDFHVKLPPASNGQANGGTIKYAVVPYSAWVPVWDAQRSTPLTQTVPVLKSGVISIPYTPKASVELVLAELWINGHRVDREERAIGVRNDLAKAPPQSAEIHDVAGLAALNGGLLVSSQLNGFFESSGENAVQVFSDHLDEVKKLSPLVEILPSLERLEPVPGVYDWDYLQQFFEAAKAHGCAVIPYLAQKWPASWAPIDFMLDENGRAHALPIVWRHMVGGYNYPTGATAPGLIREFNTQLARRFVNETGFAGYYFENEWINEGGPNSYDAGNRATFQRYLKTRYHDVASLNSTYGTTYASFRQVNIPTFNIADFPKKVMHADFVDYDSFACEQFTRDSQFDAVRAEEKRRPILIYTVGGEMSTPFLTHLQEDNGLITNGGVHALEDADLYRDPFSSVPGLLERMEPHDVAHFEPVPHGLDEMIFGMLAMGGGGMNYHAMHTIGPDDHFTFENYCKDPQVGYARLLSRLHAMRELRPTEKLHDPVGIFNLPQAADFIGGSYNYTVRNLMAGVYVHQHYEPKICHVRLDPRYLDDTKIIFVSGELVDRRSTAYFANYLRQGGHVVLDDNAASISFEHPDDWSGTNALLTSIGIDPWSNGTQIAGITVPHDVYACGKGAVVILRSKDVANKWSDLVPPLMQWAGVTNTLASSDDPYMQMHTLQGPHATYLAVTHVGYDINAYNGPLDWSGRIRFFHAGADNKYQVDQIWADQDQPIGVLTGKQLAEGFDAGHFDELEMKIYRISLIP